MIFRSMPYMLYKYPVVIPVLQCSMPSEFNYQCQANQPRVSGGHKRSRGIQLEATNARPANLWFQPAVRDLAEFVEERRFRYLSQDSLRD